MDVPLRVGPRAQREGTMIHRIQINVWLWLGLVASAVPFAPSCTVIVTLVGRFSSRSGEALFQLRRLRAFLLCFCIPP